MAREPIPAWFFVLVVARRGGRFLVVQEKKHGRRWSFPGGRVEMGETLIEAAVRETLEEAGIRVEIDGILRIEHTPVEGGAVRVRVFFTAHALDDRPPKSIADDESLQAAWVTLEELDPLPLRDREVARVFHAVAEGAPVMPLSMLGSER